MLEQVAAKVVEKVVEKAVENVKETIEAKVENLESKGLIDNNDKCKIFDTVEKADMKIKEIVEHYNETIEKVDMVPHLPKLEGENGRFNGERGDSTYYPKLDRIPLNSNPDGKQNKEIFENHNQEGIKFKDGFPLLEPFAKVIVKIENFTENRDMNFKQADMEAAKLRGCTPQEVKKWRIENNYTWHECEDCKTMQKVDCAVHNNIPHAGGIAMYKHKMGGM